MSEAIENNQTLQDESAYRLLCRHATLTVTKDEPEVALVRTKALKVHAKDKKKDEML